MNSKQAKKFRKAIRTALKDGLTPDMVDAAAARVMHLEIELKNKEREIDALAMIIKAMQEQQQTELNKEYENIPQVLK